MRIIHLLSAAPGWGAPTGDREPTPREERGFAGMPGLVVLAPCLLTGWAGGVCEGFAGRVAGMPGLIDLAPCLLTGWAGGVCEGFAGRVAGMLGLVALGGCLLTG